MQLPATATCLPARLTPCWQATLINGCACTCAGIPVAVTPGGCLLSGSASLPHLPPWHRGEHCHVSMMLPAPAGSRWPAHTALPHHTCPAGVPPPLQALHQWLLAHVAAPYPSHEVKEQLAAAWGLSKHQVRGWLGRGGEGGTTSCPHLAAATLRAALVGRPSVCPLALSACSS